MRKHDSIFFIGVIIGSFFLTSCNTNKEQFSLTSKSYEMWRNYITPTKNESLWKSIPWRSSFRQGLLDAIEDQKPLLLWAMNGHPLGCTWNNGVAGRRFVWSDPLIIEVAKQFIPTTDEVWRLQRVQDSDAIFFQEMANKGHYRTAGRTRQGIYVCSPNGKLLSSINSLNADDVLKSI